MTSEIEIKPEAVEFGMVLEDVDYGDEYQPRMRSYRAIQHRKFTGYDQNLPMVIYGFREHTVHGTSKDGLPQTLIVFCWGLQQRKRGRRFKSVTLRAIFATTRVKNQSKGGSGPDVRYDPDVKAVEPNGTYSLLETPVTMTDTRSVEAGFEGGMQFAKGTAKVIYTLSTSAVGSDQISFSGCPRVQYDSSDIGAVGAPDRCNAVEWKLFENEATKSGLPTCFRTAVLLEHRPEDTDRFTATFTCHGEVNSLTDAWTSVKRCFGLVPHDDPITFDPNVNEGSPLEIHKKKLDTYPLFDMCKCVMFEAKLDTKEPAPVEKVGKVKDNEGSIQKTGE